MPLLVSPIDGSPMRQIHRFGIELDICPSSGGVWLDKGELEKIMSLIREAAQEEKRKPDWREPRHYEHHEYQRKGGRKRPKSAMKKVMDIFDF